MKPPKTVSSTPTSGGWVVTTTCVPRSFGLSTTAPIQAGFPCPLVNHSLPSGPREIATAFVSAALTSPTKVSVATLISPIKSLPVAVNQMVLAYVPLLGPTDRSLPVPLTGISALMLPVPGPVGGASTPT